MGLRKTPQSPVEVARTNVASALDAFTTAAVNLENAAATFEEAIRANDKVVAAAQAENENLRVEVDQARTVAQRLIDLTS